MYVSLTIWHPCGRCCKFSSIPVLCGALLIHSKDFKAIVCGWLESSEGIGPNCDVSHSLPISPHHKLSDSIPVIDFIWCRVSPGDSDGGSIAACYS